MITAEEALRAVLDALPPPRAETVPLDRAWGRILAEDLRADWDLPPYDNAALDGFAVRAADLGGATGTTPIELAIVDRIFAGQTPQRAIGPGEAAHIMTGAPMPPGADAMVRQEATVVRGDRVAIRIAAEPGDNVRRSGEDIRAGTLVVAAGTPIDGPVAAALAAFGRVPVTVRVRPSVAIVPTGDELHRPEDARPGVVVESNAPMIAAMLGEIGIEARRQPIARDRQAGLAAALGAALVDTDVLVTTGGASVGEKDLVRATFEALGAEILFWKVAIKPGKAVGAARLGDKLLLGLPGNPAACAATFESFVRPAVLAWQGASAIERPRLPAILDGETRKQPAFRYVMRGSARLTAAGLRVRMPPRQGSGQLSPTLRHNAIVELDRGPGTFAPGDPVHVRLVGPLHSTTLPPVIGFAGTSDSGKTTLVTRVMTLLSQRGLRVGAIKHAAHGFQLDPAGTDSSRLREAGAAAVGLAGPTGHMVVVGSDRGATLAETISSLPSDLDLVVVEGFKHAPIPKVEVHRAGRPLLCAGEIADVFAVVSDDPSIADQCDVPVLGPDRLEQLVDLIGRTTGLDLVRASMARDEA